MRIRQRVEFPGIGGQVIQGPAGKLQKTPSPFANRKKFSPPELVRDSCLPHGGVPSFDEKTKESLNTRIFANKIRGYLGYLNGRNEPRLIDRIPSSYSADPVEKCHGDFALASARLLEQYNDGKARAGLSPREIVQVQLLQTYRFHHKVVMDAHVFHENAHWEGVLQGFMARVRAHYWQKPREIRSRDAKTPEDKAEGEYGLWWMVQLNDFKNNSLNAYRKRRLAEEGLLQTRTRIEGKDLVTSEIILNSFYWGFYRYLRLRAMRRKDPHDLKLKEAYEDAHRWMWRRYMDAKEGALEPKYAAEMNRIKVPMPVSIWRENEAKLQNNRHEQKWRSCFNIFLKLREAGLVGLTKEERGKLYIWTNTQRRAFYAGGMPLDREKLLREHYFSLYYNDTKAVHRVGKLHEICDFHERKGRWPRKESREDKAEEREYEISLAWSFYYTMGKMGANEFTQAQIHPHDLERFVKFRIFPEKTA